MLVCIKRGYQHGCRSCYKIMLGKLTLTREDLIAYLNLSFNANMKYPPNCCFRDIYNWAQRHIPSIKPLANMLESIIFVTIIRAKRFLLNYSNE